MITCANCGTVNQPETQFCSNCGTALKTASAETPAPTAEEAPPPMDASIPAATDSTPPVSSEAVPSSVAPSPMVQPLQPTPNIGSQPPVVPVPTGYSPQPAYPPPYAYAPRPPKDRSVALILEILPNLFGLFGFGWIYSGNTSVGIIWLIGVLFWDFIALLIGIVTAGFGCFCTVPINIGLTALSAVLLHSYTKKHPDLFGA